MENNEETTQPQARRLHQVDKYGPKLVDKTEKLQQRAVTSMKVATDSDRNKPAGGFDSTPIPHAPPGYTVKFTFHRGDNLPFGDFGSFSSDPYVKAQLLVDLPKRHKQDADLAFRTPTVRKNLNPVWNSEWIVANVPASGFQLKCHVFDEDAADHDDKLGNAYVEVNSLSESWSGIKEQRFKVKKRKASKRVYVFGNIASFASRRHDTSAYIIVSVECLGKTPGTEGGRAYTVGPNYWFKHFSPLIGRLAGTKDEVQTQNGKKAVSRYNFQAIQIQLTGPVPAKLYHRYVEFRPFVAGMFTSTSLRGRILNRALHHQHERIYNFDRTTLDGAFSCPCVELTQKFLEFTHHGEGGRIFTYVLTLDGQFRFTETGKEFGIDLLSKHTMHSNVSIYIAYSGEFFFRRRKHRHRRRSHATEPSESEVPVEETHEEPILEASTDPADYELFIDNDSGTYRPNGNCLHLLKEFFSVNFPGLHVTTLDSQADAERMGAMKEEQRECKSKDGHQMTYLQQSSTSSLSLSLSSSDEEELDERSGQRSKQRGEFAQRVHEMRDVKGQVMKWAQDGHHSNPKHHLHAGKAPASEEASASKCADGPSHS